jgi:heptosyltransferase-1
MPGPRILFVKLSSLGDVVHHLPAVTDAALHHPDAHIAWAVEEAYVDIARLHPAVARTIAVGLRGLRRNPFAGGRWAGLRAARREVREGRWDYVIDTQGLIKSGWIAHASGAPRFGLDAASARERLAARFYDVKFAVPRELHAVERNRVLVGAVLGYKPLGEARYGIVAPPQSPDWAPRSPYVVMLHAASRASKRWANAHWVDLAKTLSAQGYTAIFPGGTQTEREAAAALAREIRGAIAAPAMGLLQAAALLAHADGVVGVDTGLTHLAVALGVPTVGIYGATSPSLTGLHGGARAVNVGAAGKPPSVAEVAAAIGLAGAAPR